MSVIDWRTTSRACRGGRAEVHGPVTSNTYASVAPAAAAAARGTLAATPPSMSRSPFQATGGKTPGSAVLARTAPPPGPGRGGAPHRRRGRWRRPRGGPPRPRSARRGGTPRRGRADAGVVEMGAASHHVDEVLRGGSRRRSSRPASRARSAGAVAPARGRGRRRYEALMAPTEIPTRRPNRRPSASSTSTAPTCNAPRFPPPESTSARLTVPSERWRGATAWSAAPLPPG